MSFWPLLLDRRLQTYQMQLRFSVPSWQLQRQIVASSHIADRLGFFTPLCYTGLKDLGTGVVEIAGTAVKGQDG